MATDVGTRLVSALLRNQNKFAPILGFALTSTNARQLDLSVHNKELQKHSNHEDYTKTLDRENFVWLGGYGEERNIYSKASLFSQDDRCMHLGVDITLKPNTPIYAPFNARIHSFQNNDKPFDYGPTIILEHDLDENIQFYTLYGHLSTISLENLTVGQVIDQGQLVGYVGNKSENGGWNPHLHFQIISDMEDMKGDYPGVASKRDAVAMLHKCPDPQFILGFPDKPMEENENKTEFHIQEYECGQKTNLYRLDNQHDCRNLSSMKKQSNTSFISLIRAFFYPDNYPLGVSSDYGIYQFYNIFQTGCIAISGALAFSALFRGMGVGESASNSLAASIVWLLKDGAGMIGRIIFAWGFAASLDADCKRWHFFGDMLNDIACILDLITPYFQSALLFISSVSNICRAVTAVIHGSTRTVIFQHQARNNNVADITAKCSSLETMVSLVALFVNVILLSILPTGLIWPLFLILTCGHLWGNYQAKRCILFNVFNHQRFHLVCSKYFQTNGQEILSIEQVNNQEPILFQMSIPYHSYLGISLNRIPKSIFPSQNQLKHFHDNESERFLLLYDEQTNSFYALLKPYSDNDDLIRLNFFMEILSYAMKSTIEQTDDEFQMIVHRIRKQLPNLSLCLDIFHENNDSCYEQFKQICIHHGYNFHRCLFNIEVFRVQ